MDSEKRIVGDYVITNSFRIGGKEVLLGENLNIHSDDRYACGYAVQTDLFEQYSDFVVSDDYSEIVEEYANRIKEQLEVIKTQMPAEKEYKKEITADSCNTADYTQSIKGEVVAIDPRKLSPEYRNAVNQICYVTGGFGSEANARGQSVFCTEVYSGESARYDRNSILGVIKSECIPQWAKNKLLIIKDDKNVFEQSGKHFLPFRQLQGKEQFFDTASRLIQSENILDNYSRKAFYEKSGNSKADLFLCLENDKLYIPGDKELFAWIGDRGKQDERLISPSHKKRDYER